MNSPLGRLLKLAAPLTWRFALAVLLGVVTIGSSIGLMTTSAYLIARAALHPSIADLQVAIVGVRFFGIARGLSRYAERLVSHDVTFRLLARLRSWFYRALEPLAPARLLQFRSGDLLARIVADVETLENFYLRVLAPPVVAVLVALLAALLVGLFDIRLSLVLLAFLLLAGAGVPLLTRAGDRRTGQRVVRMRAELNGVLVDGIQGMADLLAFGQGERHLDLVRRLSREMGSVQEQRTRSGGLHGALTGLLMNLATLSVLALAVPLVSNGRIEGVHLALLVLAAMSSFEAVWPLPQAFQSLEQNREAAHRLLEIVDARPAVAEPLSPLPAPSGFGLRVEGLQFAYGQDPAALPVLAGVSFDLPEATSLAIVGPNGAGKSTLVGVLLRFWDYREGHIVLDGQELRDYHPEDVRRLASVVGPHSHLFNTTVRENLLLAKPNASEAELIYAAQQAQAHEFILSLPQRYDTFVGEQGVRLSGGERQRLLLTRALLADAPILILDEPTANLDPLTERELMNTLPVVAAGRTMLIITHRLVGLEAMDRILVLQAGRVVQSGRHAELVATDGLYRRMWESQTQVLEDTVSLPA